MTSPDRGAGLTDPRLRAAVVCTLVLFLVAALAFVVVGGPRHGRHDTGVLSSNSSTTATASPTGTFTQPPVTIDPAAITSTRVSTFNMLGASHTAPGGNKHGWASGEQRTKWAASIIRAYKLQIVGMQEFQVPQFKEFVAQFGATYGVYPARYLGDVAVQNSIAWDRTKFRAIEQHTMKIPYFHGAMTDEPYILLQSLQTGQTLWVYNSHNPAGVAGAGDTKKYRAQAVAKEVSLFNSLQTKYPGVPIIDLGDKNDAAPYFCSITPKTDLHAAAGGSYASATHTCTMPTPSTIDWIMGTPEVSFSGYRILNTPLVRKTTDHHVYFADVTLPPSNALRYVVGVDLEGLSSRALNDASIPLPNLRALMTGGASLSNARTAYESVLGLPNSIGMLTSLPAGPAFGGTGVKDVAHPPSVTVSHGSYVPSVFDVVHDAGLSTGVWTSDDRLASVIRSTWTGAHGAPDTTGGDNGRNKVSAVHVTALDKAAVSGVVSDLRTSPRSFELLALSAAEKAGLAYGNRSPQYAAALKALDSYLGQLRTVIANSSVLRGHTAIILTSDHGAVRRGWLKTTVRDAYRVPFIVWGPGVTRLPGLYGGNPQLRNPGGTRPMYSGPQPVRNLALGNLATQLLGLPAIPGSRIDAAHDLRLSAAG